MINSSNLKEFVSFANFLADESEIVIKEHFRKTFTTEIKDDRTPCLLYTSDAADE